MKSDIETLKAWSHWKRKEKDLSESDSDFVKAIEDVISQVGTFKSKLEAATKERDEFSLSLEETIDKLDDETDALNKQLEKIEKLEDALHIAREALRFILDEPTDNPCIVSILRSRAADALEDLAGR